MIMKYKIFKDKNWSCVKNICWAFKQFSSLALTKLLGFHMGFLCNMNQIFFLFLYFPNQILGWKGCGQGFLTNIVFTLWTTLRMPFTLWICFDINTILIPRAFMWLSRMPIVPSDRFTITLIDKISFIQRFVWQQSQSVECKIVFRCFENRIPNTKIWPPISQDFQAVE